MEAGYSRCSARSVRGKITWSKMDGKLDCTKARAKSLSQLFVDVANDGQLGAAPYSRLASAILIVNIYYLYGSPL